jgi:hypothetical protein
MPAGSALLPLVPDFGTSKVLVESFVHQASFGFHQSPKERLLTEVRVVVPSREFRPKQGSAGFVSKLLKARHDGAPAERKPGHPAFSMINYASS